MKDIPSEKLIEEIIRRIGDDPAGEHCLDTPKRVVKSWKELFSGYSKTPEDALGTTFRANGHDQMVICRDIEMYSACSHHMVPFFGKVHIGYIPGDVVVGLSKLARLVEVFSRRLQVQERLTDQIADAIETVLHPKGVMVVVEAKHLCMCSRGIQKQHSSMVTSAIRGVFQKSDARQEFMALIKQ
jgi:GTP cyclohydrolase IA